MSDTSSKEEIVRLVPVANTTRFATVQAQEVELTDSHVLSAPNVSRPVTGIIGHSFMRVCFLVDLLASWIHRNTPTPTQNHSRLPAALGEVAADAANFSQSP
jgi:hypothetical protein